MAELMALDQCLEILVNSSSPNVIIEADSELIIREANKISNGTSPDKVLKHWKLLRVFYRIYSRLRTLKTIRFSHVKRKANMLADRLANEGVTNKDRDSWYAWVFFPQVNCGRTVSVKLLRIWNYGLTGWIKGTLKTSGGLENSTQSNQTCFRYFPKSRSH